MTTRQIVLAALTAALSADTSGDARTAHRPFRGQCHDVAKAGQHACAGLSCVDRTPGEWAYGAYGACGAEGAR